MANSGLLNICATENMAEAEEFRLTRRSNS